MAGMGHNGDADERLRLLIERVERLGEEKKCIADDIKFDRSGLSHIEGGRTGRPSLKVVRALAAVLELEPGEMFKPEDGPDEDDDESEAA